MSEQFVNLNCANCGAKLDVYVDMERFACGYCGTEMVVQRRGGTVALKAVTEAIKNVRIGTDKTAAELALVRLDQDSVRLNEQLKKLIAEAEAEPIANRGLRHGRRSDCWRTCRRVPRSGGVRIFSWLSNRCRKSCFVRSRDGQHPQPRPFRSKLPQNKPRSKVSNIALRSSEGS